MANPGKVTEFCKLILSQTTKDTHAPLVPMFFPILGAHMCGAEFQYPDLTWKEPTGMMANLVAESGGNKGQLSNLVEALCRDFRTPKQFHIAFTFDMGYSPPAHEDAFARPREDGFSGSRSGILRLIFGSSAAHLRFISESLSGRKPEGMPKTCPRKTETYGRPAAAGYRPKSHYLTPRQVEIIYN